MLLSTTIKFAPFASRQRRGYLRDNSERDLAVHLETALRGVIISERWPKSRLDVVITILEGEDDSWWDTGIHSSSAPQQLSYGLMSVLAGCITAASTAIVDAGIDCVDVVSGGVAAIVPVTDSQDENSDYQIVLDPCPSEHESIIACCVVGYLKARDEITEVWLRGGMPVKSQVGTANQPEVEALLNGAVQAAAAVHSVIVNSIKENV
jgi:exosome complex component MTR3